MKNINTEPPEDTQQCPVDQMNVHSMAHINRTEPDKEAHPYPRIQELRQEDSRFDTRSEIHSRTIFFFRCRISGFVGQASLCTHMDPLSSAGIKGLC